MNASFMEVLQSKCQGGKVFQPRTSLLISGYNRMNVGKKLLVLVVGDWTLEVGGSKLKGAGYLIMDPYSALLVFPFRE